MPKFPIFLKTRGFIYFILPIYIHILTHETEFAKQIKKINLGGLRDFVVPYYNIELDRIQALLILQDEVKYGTNLTY